LKIYFESESFASQALVTNFFYEPCSTLMYRITRGLSGHSLLRLGTVNDYKFVVTKLRPLTQSDIKFPVSGFQGVFGEKSVISKGSHFKFMDWKNKDL